MTRRYERLFGYGVRELNYDVKESWTDEVRALYKRLQERDHAVVADLLKHDIEFLCDQQVLVSIITLKFAPDMPEAYCRAQLRRIANVIRRRPSRKRRRLPYGDRLWAELMALTKLIQERGLLEVQDDRQAILDRLVVVRSNPLQEFNPECRGRMVTDPTDVEDLLGLSRIQREIEKMRTNSPKIAPPTPSDEQVNLARVLYEVRRENPRRLRGARSWALQALAKHYCTGPEQIETAITRDGLSTRTRRASPPSE